MNGLGGHIWSKNSLCYYLILHKATNFKIFQNSLGMCAYTPVL